MAADANGAAKNTRFLQNELEEDGAVAAEETNKKRRGGPKTAAGKARVRRNPIKHGVLAQTPVIPLVAREEDDAVEDHTTDNHQPEATRSGAARPRKRKAGRGGRRPGRACPERPDAIAAVEGAPAPAPPAKRSWGGKRAGAGAPKGNLNGFKHGRRSRQLAEAVMFFAGNPTTRATLISLANRYRVKQEKTEDVAARFFVNAINKGIKIENEEQARAIMGLLRAMAEK